MTDFGQVVCKINYLQKCDLYSNATYYFLVFIIIFLNLIMHFRVGATWSQENMVVVCRCKRVESIVLFWCWPG